MDLTVFFAWQSDSPRDDNKHLIRDAAKAAVKIINKDGSVSESPRLDSALEWTSGTPEVATTLFRKIDDSGFFIGDVTFVGTTLVGPKLLPNPNVVAELAYAAKSIGWERVILVMNTHYGPVEQQFFDIRHRDFPIRYDLPPNRPNQRPDAEISLTNQIEARLRTAMKAEHRGAVRASRALTEDCLRLMAINGQQDCFFTPRPEAYNDAAQSLLDRPDFQRAVERLLDLQIIWCQMDAEEQLYAYHWTYLGHQVMRHLKYRTDNPLSNNAPA